MGITHLGESQKKHETWDDIHGGDAWSWFAMFCSNDSKLSGKALDAVFLVDTGAPQTYISKKHCSF